MDSPLASKVTSIDDTLLTPPGVNPDDPEEIARKDYYSKHREIFDVIEGVNQRKYFVVLRLLCCYCFLYDQHYPE